jgi:protein gp37
MGDVTKIEWADHTFNPWIGCTKVSPACDNCYAEAMMDHRYGRAKWGAGNPRARTSPSNWAKPRKWNRDAEKTGTHPFVFCASLADVFDNEVDPAWRGDLFALFDATPNLIWLLLTKRIGNVLKMTDGVLPCNVAIGATMADQTEYDRDRMKLAEVKRVLHPAFTFGSFEPLLGPVILDKNAPDWIIVGGESGGNARPMALDWARSIKRQSTELDRVFNFKQVGGRGGDKGGHELDGQTYFARPAKEDV